MSKADKTSVKRWHDGIDSIYFETKTGSLNWYRLAEIFITLYNQDCTEYIERSLLAEDNGLVFVRTQNLKISPKIYKYLSHPSVRIHHTIDAVNCGRSSYTLLQHIADNKGNILATNHLILVYVSKDSRQSIQLPDFFRNAVMKSTSLVNQTSRIDLKKYVCPPNYFQLVFTVVYTDLDHNGHATQTSYIRHVFNTFIAAVEAKALGDINMNDVLSATDIRFAYENEGNLGSRLVVKVWSDEFSGLHGQITDENNPSNILFRAFRVRNKTAKL